ncbi:MAG TPA: type II secretion system protein [Pyrinomonadaceae bacterium]|nr:type II secretion system protein [Pyrinomonadaceae bacterium]
MTNRRFASEDGYSLIEIVLVMVIMAIMTTFAILALGSSTQNLDRQNITKEFKVSLERARFDSVRRRASECTDMARVEITSATTYNIVTDVNQNGAIDSDDYRPVDFGSRSLVQMVDDPVPTYPVIIRFDERGNASSGTCGAETPVDSPTVFCEIPCTADTATALNSNIVFVSPTGTAAMLTGGETIPTFADPTTTSVDSASQINPLLAVWDLIVEATPTPSVTPSVSPTVPPTATPSPSPTDTPTPTPTPTVTVTPTPDPSASPTPSPTPNYCVSGQYPGTNGCICSPTQYLHNNGKCRNL